MNSTIKRISVILLVTLATVAIVLAATIVWQYTTVITVTEPFEVNTNLPEQIELPPGEYHFVINVTNHASKSYNAMLLYSYQLVNITDFEVKPVNGTQILVPAGSTVAFNITISIGAPTGASGKVTINWRIVRE